MGEFCVNNDEVCGFHKKRGISQAAAQLPDFQNRLCSIELVNFYTSYLLRTFMRFYIPVTKKLYLAIFLKTRVAS